MASPPIKPAQLKQFLGAARESGCCTTPASSSSASADTSDRDDQASTESLLSSLSSACQSLLCLELAQRGVLVKGAPFDAASDDCVNGDIASILDGVISTAGRSLLGGESATNLPKPMMAATSAVMAMCAERCAELVGSLATSSPSSSSSQLQSSDLPTNLLLHATSATPPTKSKFNSAQTRCTDVDDIRLSSLLSLALQLRPQSKTTDGPAPKHKDIVAHLHQYRTILLRIASGQYLRAAVEFSASDQPQMWKRCLDAVLNLNSALIEKSEFDSGGGQVSGEEVEEYRQYDTVDAALPLSNLIRIAGDKGNAKRVSELGLRLAQSYLASVDDSGGVNAATTGSTSGDGGDIDDKGKLLVAIREVFWNVYHSKGGGLAATTTTAQYAERAHKAAEKVDLPLLVSNADLSDTDRANFRLLHGIVVLRAKLAIEQAEINGMADDNWTAAKNRADEKSGGVGRGGIVGLAKTKKQKALEEDLSRDRFVTEATRSILLEEDSEGVNAAALALRDEVIASVLHKNDIAETAPLDAAFALIGRQVDRLMERARGIAIVSSKPKKKSTKKWDQTQVDDAWASVDSFVTSLLQLFAKDEGAIINEASREARQSVCLSAIGSITARWMISSEEKSMTVDAALPSFLLSKCKTVFAKEKGDEMKRRKEMGEDAIGATGIDEGDPGRDLLVESALSSAYCWSGLALAAHDKGISKHIRAATSTALKRERKITSKHQKELLGKVGSPFLQLLTAWSGLHRSPWMICTVTQARSIVSYAKESQNLCLSAWGRAPTPLETLFLELAQADAECYLPGGFAPDAEKLYQMVLVSLADAECCIEESISTLLRAHCLCGLSKMALEGGTPQENNSKPADEYARECLEMFGQSSDSNGTLSEWRDPSSIKSSIDFHICSARQLVAESLLRDSRPDDAQSYLEEAVKAAPQDYNASFALGSFRLRMVLSNENPSAADKKLAQTQLLKAAKLDTEKADPFALLGLWYEVQGDDKRALGCHSKALILDSTHPVAGRGVLRMKPYKDVEHLCSAATSTTSAVHGWAWRAIGRGKVMDDGDDESAAVCFQQALRCRDIEAASNESLAFFYEKPDGSDIDVAYNVSECGETWSDLAGCYRRLGKYSASLRAYVAAGAASEGHIPPSIRCAWAHVELELGLYDDAVAKFEAVISDENSSTSLPLALYGHGTAMLALSRMYFNEGKLGSVLIHLEKGIKSVESLFTDSEESPSTKSNACALKLLGDLYSFGSTLPASLFADDSIKESPDCSSHDNATRAKLAFVSQGYDAYSKVLAFHNRIKEEDGGKSEESNNASLLIAAASFDIGTNLLCQAQMLATSLGEGSGSATETGMLDIARKCPEIQARVDRSIESFRAAIDTDGCFAPAWCGLGSALCYKDLLLAQHCFCRAVQIDPVAADGWSNLGMVYSDFSIPLASSETLDALTQVADTPFMWIGRALLLEKEGESERGDEANLSRASDAYRAALQVANHPTALLGLSLTARRLGLSEVMEEQNVAYAESAHLSSTRESHLALSMHQHLGGYYNIGSRAFESVHMSEQAIERLSNGHAAFGKDTLACGEGIDDTTKLLELLSLDSNDEVLKHENEGESMSILLQRSSDAATTVKAIASRPADVEQAMKGADKDIENGLANARLKVRLYPNNGENFLDFAKELAKEFTAMEEPSENSKFALTSAVERATSLLLDEVTDVHMLAPRRPITIEQHDDAKDAGNVAHHDLSMHKNVVPKVVDASVVSEALALKIWLPAPVEDGDEAAVAIAEASSMANIHRSLLLDPENTFARSLLDAESF